MYINGVEEESETLIDDDADTCVNLTGSDGCTMDRAWNLFKIFSVKLDRVLNLIMFRPSD